MLYIVVKKSVCLSQQPFKQLFIYKQLLDFLMLVSPVYINWQIKHRQSANINSLPNQAILYPF